MNKCIDCGRQTKNKIAKRCRKCYIKTLKGKGNPNFGNRYAKKYYCIDCGEKICYHTWKYGSKRCQSCANKGKNNHWYGTKGYWFNKHLSKDTRIKISKNQRGSKHWNWQDGKSFEEYPEKFYKIREQIRKRDNCQCQLCNKTQKANRRKLDVHHIDYNKENCDEDNLISLCWKCNLIVNNNRDYWYAYFTYIMEKNNEKEML